VFPRFLAEGRLTVNTRNPRRVISFIGIVFFLSILSVFGWGIIVRAEPELTEASAISSQEYVVIGWNDLGMHCISPSFKEMAILPPFNNLWVQVIRRGDPPKVVTSNIALEYSVLKNTTVAGKTDFWQYVRQLFGVNLSEGVGLTGNRLFGTMRLVGDHFEATGIPVLPYDDAMNWNPYQIAIIKLKNSLGTVLKTTRVVLPVSDELNCAMCHATGADASANYGINTPTLEGNILTIHDIISQTDLMAQTPVLCASCHASNALGMSGDPNRRSLSEAIHWKHSTLLSLGYTDLPGCYDCHPGAKTRCMRTGIGGMGYSGTDPSCPSCHGDLAQVAGSISQGRQPWLQEPSCEQCHGLNMTTGQDLYRHSKGHGNIYCTACHNSPHSWWPSKLLVDNDQPLTLQGSPTSIRNCLVCHQTKPQRYNNNPHVTFLKDAHLFAFPDSFDFGNVKVGKQKTQTLILANKGTKNIKITGSDIIGSDASMFKTGTKILGNLKPGEREGYTIVFEPSSGGSKTATLSINSSDPVLPTLEISLTGNGW
jgi:hypothetical protein